MPPGIGYEGGQMPSPSRLAQLLQTPGLRDALIAAGSSLLAQQDQPGSLAGAIGRSLPMGVQAFEQGRQESALQEVFADAPESMQRLMRALPLAQQQMLAMQQMMQGPPEPKVVGRSLVDPSTGEAIYRDPESDPSVLREFEAFRAANPEMSDAEAWGAFYEARRGPGTSVTVDTGTIPPGYRAVRDEQGRMIQMEVIPGGPVAREIEAEERERIAGLEGASRQAQTVVEDTQRALEVLQRHGRAAAGVGGLTRAIPEAPAHQLAQHVESIKGNIGVDRLMWIKESGAGLGHIPQAQLDMLSSLLGRLDVTMRPEDLRFNLQRIQDLYLPIAEALRDMSNEPAPGREDPMGIR